MYKKEKVLKMCRISIFIITFFIASTINNVLSSLPLRNTIDNNNKYKIELYDPRHRSDDGWDKIEYYTKSRLSLSQNSFSFLQESASADPDPQALGPARLDCDCTFKKANPTGRPDSQYHYGKIPNQKVNYLSDQKLRNVIKSEAAAGSKVPEIRNIDLATGKIIKHHGGNVNKAQNSIYKDTDGTSFMELNEEKLTFEFLLPEEEDDDEKK